MPVILSEVEGPHTFVVCGTAAAVVFRLVLDFRAGFRLGCRVTEWSQFHCPLMIPMNLPVLIFQRRGPYNRTKASKSLRFAAATDLHFVFSPQQAARHNAVVSVCTA